MYLPQLAVKYFVKIYDVYNEVNCKVLSLPLIPLHVMVKYIYIITQASCFKIKFIKTSFKSVFNVQQTELFKTSKKRL